MGKATAKKELKYLILGMVFLSSCGHEVLEGSYPSTATTPENPKTDGIEYSNTVSSPKEMRAGDLFFVNYDGAGQAKVDLTGVEEEAAFTLVLGDAGAQVGAQGNVAAPNLDPKEKLEQTLRSRETSLALSADFVDEQSFSGKAMALSESVQVGSTKTFRVLGSVTSATIYNTVTATAECIGNNVIFYVDNQVSASDLSTDDINQLCDRFDIVAGVEQDLFGSASDINHDGHVIVLMTPQVNRLGALGGGIITGFFNASDLLKNSSANPVSNEAEILFTLVPDSHGIYGTSISKSFAMDNLLPSVLPHELQHAISYNQHVLVNRGAPEEPWLNEGLSHLAEDVMGHGVENPSRSAIYLRSPSSYPLVSLGSPNLGERGGAYLFMRYLYEQSADGNEFLKKLLNTNQTGAKNMETAFEGRDRSFDEFSEFFVNWQAALVLSGTGVTKDSKYNYNDRTRNVETGLWSGVCLHCDAEDGRGTVLDGVTALSYFNGSSQNMTATTSKFLRLSSLDNLLQLQGDASNAFGVLIRTR